MTRTSVIDGARGLKQFRHDTEKLERSLSYMVTKKDTAVLDAVHENSGTITLTSL